MTVKISTAIEMPELLLDSERLNNKFVRDGVQIEANIHGINRLKLHFLRSATRRYGYTPRVSKKGRLSYSAWKQKVFGSNRDLVLTGASERFITSRANQDITVRGAASNGTIEAKIKTRFPWKGGTGKKKAGNKKQGATPDVLVREVEKIIPEEAKEISVSIRNRYLKDCDDHMARRKRRRRSNVGGP